MYLYHLILSVLAKSRNRDLWGDVRDFDGHPGVGHLRHPNIPASTRE